ncbi:hypothetical protein EVAR_20934_1 [Eumeta japonica]|uniref:Uncharacterized protein n=1 Tax=Eumeta variegata TaxID=151549 RepID=A0A4C1UVG6_EUMVA|nr:hypothetical protein EVAR_20934_1 [Eumeta japonica]
MTDRTKPVTAAHDRRTSRASELLEVVLRNLENPSKSKRVPHPGKPFPPRSEIKKIPAKTTKSKEGTGSTVGPVMAPDKRTRGQLSPSPILEPKKYATDSKPAHIILNTPQSPSLCGVAARLFHPTAAWKRN